MARPMLRIDDVTVAEALCMDFLTTWAGEKSEISQKTDEMELHCISGKSNHELFGRILTMIEEAKDQVFVESLILLSHS